MTARLIHNGSNAYYISQDGHLSVLPKPSRRRKNRVPLSWQYGVYTKVERMLWTEGKTVAQVAEALNLSVSSVRRLRKIIKKRRGEDV